MTEDRFEHRGYTVVWTGWKPYYENEVLIAQWVAQKDGVEGRLHVCLPFGSCTWHMIGDNFDIRPIDNWLVQSTIVDVFTSEEVKESWKETGRSRMVELIDHWIDKLKQKPPKKKESQYNPYISMSTVTSVLPYGTGGSPYSPYLTPATAPTITYPSYTTGTSWDINTYTTTTYK